MKTHAVRLYGENDLRLESFELPEINEDEILARIISDSLCMSSYKAAIQGERHKRVPEDISENPVIIGHEFCGEIVCVGRTWKNKYKEGHKFTVQPALNLKHNLYLAPGYSYKYVGGNATYIILPADVMEQDCLLPYEGDDFYMGSLAEPMSCIIGAFKGNYHTTKGSYEHEMGIKENGRMAILAGVGPMGLGAIDYAINGERRPRQLVVTDIDEARLKRAAAIYTVEAAKEKGVELIYVNTMNVSDPVAELMSYTEGDGYDDVFVMAPVRPVVEQGSKILAYDGCLNFFAGPTDKSFSAEFNFYDVHYNSVHIAGTSGGNTDDMREALALMASGEINPSAMITHIGGIDSAADTTLRLPKIPGGKKLIYTNISMPLTAIDDLEALGLENDMLRRLAEIVAENGGLWCREAEAYLLANAEAITATLS